jgi:hypothetical protein
MYLAQLHTVQWHRTSEVAFSSTEGHLIISVIRQGDAFRQVGTFCLTVKIPMVCLQKKFSFVVGTDVI